MFPYAETNLRLLGSEFSSIMPLEDVNLNIPKIEKANQNTNALNEKSSYYV